MSEKPFLMVIQNQKGGVGKTVSAATCRNYRFRFIASGLATEFQQPSSIKNTVSA
ncbi:ParA family protein (plasmid) [Vibrio splendidus]